MAFLQTSLSLVAVCLFIQSSNAGCKVVPCKDSPVKFTGSFSPCPIHRGGFVNVSVHGKAPKDMSGITYDINIFFAKDPSHPILGLSGTCDCKTVAKFKLPLMCPVKKGAEIGLKDQVIKIPVRTSLDSDSYKIQAKVYDAKDKSLVLCALIDFDLK